MLTYPAHTPGVDRAVSSKCTLHVGNFYLTRGGGGWQRRDTAVVGPWWTNRSTSSTRYPGHLLLIRDQVIGLKHTHVGMKFTSPGVILLYVFLSEELLKAYNCHLKNPAAEKSSWRYFLFNLKATTASLLLNTETSSELQRKLCVLL